jgi:hypothetical protein
MKVTLKQKNMYTAVAVTKDGQEFGFSKRNSSWYEYNIPSRKVGEEFEVSVSVSEQTGRNYITRVTAPVLMEMVELESAMFKNQILAKQVASL